MHLLGYTAGVNVIVSRHHQGRRPYPLEPLLAHAQGQVRAIEEGVDRVPHHLSEILRRHLFQRLPIHRVMLGTLGALAVTRILLDVGDHTGNEASPQQAAGYQNPKPKTLKTAPSGCLDDAASYTSLRCLVA